VGWKCGEGGWSGDVSLKDHRAGGTAGVFGDGRADDEVDADIRR